jgi:hypothetical protein
MYHCIVIQVAVISTLNKVLAKELVCMRCLFEAKNKCKDSEQDELLDRVLISLAQIRAILEESLRRLGEMALRPQPKPIRERHHDQSLDDCLREIESIQLDIVQEISPLIESPALADVHDALFAIRQFHRENVQWLAVALGEKQETLKR